jgi:hypothetical protein
MLETSRVIAYSLFGYGKATPENCFEFKSYLRCLAINIRLARLLYPNWTIIVHIDTQTYNGFNDFFDQLPIEVVICEEAPLTKAMLWRMMPCFKEYDAVICRDLDSPLTYREAQAVEYWLRNGKCVHAITDSISHNLPMLGGMIGFRPHDFIRTCNYDAWGNMLGSVNIDWNRKGADQDFLNQYIYRTYSQPQIDSITQHYVKGMPQTYLSDFHTEIQNIEVPNVPKELNASNDICGHIGAAGWYETALFKFLRQHWERFDDLLEIEKPLSNIFYWVNE